MLNIENKNIALEHLKVKISNNSPDVGNVMAEHLGLIDEKVMSVMLLLWKLQARINILMKDNSLNIL